MKKILLMLIFTLAYNFVGDLAMANVMTLKENKEEETDGVIRGMAVQEKFSDRMKELSPDLEAIILEEESAFYLKEGFGYFNDQEFLQAIEAFQEAVQINPDSKDANFNLGVTYCKLGKYEQAIPYFLKNIEITPEAVDAHYSLGVAYGSMGQKEKARKSFQEAIRLDPDYIKARQGLERVSGELSGDTE